MVLPRESQPGVEHDAGNVRSEPSMAGGAPSNSRKIDRRSRDRSRGRNAGDPLFVERAKTLWDDIQDFVLLHVVRTKESYGKRGAMLMSNRRRNRPGDTNQLKLTPYLYPPSSSRCLFD